MAKNIFSHENEKQIQQFWEENWVDKFDLNSQKPIYSIDSPPPTISWDIHMGHVFSYTQMEVVARFKKMQWYNLFYPFGFDDNWIPTEVLVEKEIWKTSRELGREEFTNQCFKTTEYYRDKLRKLWKSLGLSVDRSLEYSTISPQVQRISQKSFVKLLNEWVIYRANAPSFWCTKARSSVAQSELEYEEKEWMFYDINFYLGSWEKVTIWTTRPELLPACVAVFVHPEDERYKNIIWKDIKTPLWDQVKILGDEQVDMEKWTWVVMCCTYWDETDLYWRRKYDLPEKIIIWEDGVITDWPAKWKTLTQAKEEIVNILESQQDIENKQPITHSVAVFSRTNNPIEIISVPQWFVKVMDKKDRIKEVWARMNWYPSKMKKRFDNWVDGLEIDWNISRQRYYGVPIPVWYSKKTWEIIPPDNDQLPVNPLKDVPNTLPEWHTEDDILPESDVLDTWATSALTPFVNAKRGEEDSMEDKLMPMSLRTQAHDIISTWTFGSVIKSMYHNDDVPFENVMISGHMVAKWGEKISKSKWNAWRKPEEYIQDYWADAVRYWTCGAVLGKDIALDEEEIKKWQKLVIKLLNSAKFVFMNLSDFDVNKQIEFDKLEEIDQKMISRLQNVALNMEEYFQRFEFLYVRREFEDFFWRQFCDNYLEIVKWIIYNPWEYEDWETKKLSAQYTLYFCLNKIIKLIAPIQPHICEYLYQNYYKQAEWAISVHNTTYPGNDNLQDFDAVDTGDIDKLFHIISLIRQSKSNSWIKLWQQVSCVNIIWSSKDLEVYKKYTQYLKSVSKANSLNFQEWEELVSIE